MSEHEKLWGTVTIDETKRRLDVSINGETVEVSGALTDAELRATPVEVSGALTDAELRATPVPILEENLYCPNNSTSTLLTGGATYTGQWRDMLQYQEINVSVYSDKDSALNGLVFQWSPDGIVVGDTDVFSFYASSGGTNYTPNPAFRYFRVLYTNGAVAQTSFSLMSIFRKKMTGGSFHRIDSTLKDDSDGRLVVNVPKLRTAANNYVSQTATASGNAKMSLEELESGISVNGNSQLKVTLYTAAGTEVILTGAQPVTTINEYNVTLTLANTQYSEVIIAGAKTVEFKCRTFNDIRWSFVTGKVAGPTAPYFTLKAGYIQTLENMNFTGSKTLYLASSDTGLVVELVVLS